MAAYHLRTFYLARQAAWGTPVTPNVRMEGVTDGSVTVNVEQEVIETLGVSIGHVVMRQPTESEINISLIATYEQILYVLHGLFDKTVSAVGSSAPYTWTYKAPRTNNANPQIYTINYGIGDDMYQLGDCLLSELTMKGEVKRALELELTFICPKAPVPLSSAPNITPQVINPISLREAEFYFYPAPVDPFSNQPVEATLISFEINVATNRHIKRFIGNSAYYGEGRWEIEGSLVLEFNWLPKAIISYMSATNNALWYNIGLQFISQSSSDKQLKILMPVIIADSFELFSDRDGNATVEMKIKSFYNSDTDIETALTIEVKTPTNTLP